VLVIHRQKFDPQGRYVTVRPMAIGETFFEEGAVVPFPTEDISTDVVRRLWKDRRLVAAPATMEPTPKTDPVAPVAAAGAGSPPGGGPPRPAAPPQAQRRGR
jgi:hypothetical protein